LSVSNQLSSLFEIRHFNRRENVASRLNLGGFEQLQLPLSDVSTTPQFLEVADAQNYFLKCALNAINSTSTQASASLPFCFCPSSIYLSHVTLSVV
jgi:hypothetical protein